MRVCFRAIELNKPALLTDISPHLLKPGQTSSISVSSGRKFSTPEPRILSAGTRGRAVSAAFDSVNGRAKLIRTFSGRDNMGNRHPRLDVAYSGQLSRSNLSLSVDPSVGASSLLHQKSLSSPYFVSSLDSPRVLEHLHGDIRDAIRVTTSPGVLPNQGQAFQVVSRSGPITSGIPNHTDAFGHSGLSGSLSTGNIASQGSISSIGGTTDTGSSPQLSEVEDPEVRIVSGGGTSSAEASGGGLPLGGLQSSLGSGQTIPAGLEDSLSWGDTAAFSATTGSSDLEEGFMVQMRQKQPASQSLSRGEDKTHDILEHSNDYKQTPKSFSDAFLYEHSQSGSASSDSEQQGMAVPGQAQASDSGNSSFHYGQHQPQAIESSTTPGSTSSGCDLPGVGSYPSQEVVSRIRGSATSGRGSQASRASHVSVAMDATSLNSVLTCETDYGTDGVVLGFSPPDANADSRQPDDCAYPADQNLPQAEASSDQTDFRNSESDLPEAGRSPSGSPSDSTVADADSEKTSSFKSGAKSKMSAIRSHPHLTMSDPLLSPSPSLPGLSQSLGNPTYAYPHLRNPLEADLAASPPSFAGTVLPFSEADLYCFSPPISPHTPLSGRAGSEERGDQNLGSRECISTSVKYSGGNIYIPDRGLSLDRGLTGISAALASTPQVSDASNNHIRSSQAGEAREEGKSAVAAAATSTASSAATTATAAAAGVSSPHRRGHKRWVSDTSVIQVNQEQNRLRRSSKTNQRSTAADTGLYLSSMTKPAEGQSLISYLTSQDFNTCANLEKENAHFHIAEALISAFESMSWNRMMRQSTAAAGPRQAKSASTSSEDEEITELRQRIRIRKREKISEKGRPFPSPSDHSDQHNDAASASHSASTTVPSSRDVSSLSGASSYGSGSEDDERQIDLTKIELQKSNQQLEISSMTGRSTEGEQQGANSGSAEAVAISLLRRFSEKQLPKASELRWLVSERDAPQSLLPLPASIPVLPDDGDNSVLLQSGRQTRLRGNHEWAPPRAQIIFSVHPTEKRAVVMKRQNYRCAGCGLKVDPAYMKRYRYCEYLGKYFCQCCHTGETSAVIPGRVLERWDFAKYPVSAFSHSLLDRMWQEPLFHVSTINRSLYRRVKALDSIREGRRQLFHLHSLLVVCRRDLKIIKELQKLPAHWVSNEDAYSMEDFMQVKSGTMLSVIKAFISLAMAHIETCPLCQGLGFICEMCNNPKVIFPFQLDTVVSCQVCQACYHKQCFVPGKCPKCIRMEARRKKAHSVLKLTSVLDL